MPIFWARTDEFSLKERKIDFVDKESMGEWRRDDPETVRCILRLFFPSINFQKPFATLRLVDSAPFDATAINIINSTKRPPSAFVIYLRGGNERRLISHALARDASGKIDVRTTKRMKKGERTMSRNEITENDSITRSIYAYVLPVLYYVCMYAHAHVVTLVSIEWQSSRSAEPVAAAYFLFSNAANLAPFSDLLHCTLHRALRRSYYSMHSFHERARFRMSQCVCVCVQMHVVILLQTESKYVTRTLMHN